MLYRELDKPQSIQNTSTPPAVYVKTMAEKHAPFPQRQVCSAGVRAQTFGGATDDDGDGLPGPATEDVRARLLADGADAEREQDFSVEGDAEI